MAVVDLEGVGPAREVRIAPVGDHAGTVVGRYPQIVVGFPRQVVGAALHVEFRMRAHPRMIERGVIGHEVEHEPHAAPGQPRPEPRERVGAAEVAVNDVLPDGER